MSGEERQMSGGGVSWRMQRVERDDVRYSDICNSAVAAAAVRQSVRGARTSIKRCARDLSAQRQISLISFTGRVHDGPWPPP